MVVYATKHIDVVVANAVAANKTIVAIPNQKNFNWKQAFSDVSKKEWMKQNMKRIALS